MPTNHHFDDAPRRIYRRKSFWFGAAIVGIIVGIAVFRAVLGLQIRAQLNQIAKSGAPIDLTAVNALQPPVPINENAALEILAAADDIAKAGPSANDFKWPHGRDALTQLQKSLLADIITNNASALTRLHRGVALPGSRFPVDWRSGPSTLLPHLSKVKGLAQLLRAHSLLAIEQGNSDAAVQSLLDQFRLAHTLATEPCLISQVVRMACLQISIEALERV